MGGLMVGSRQSDLNNSFKLAIRSLLTTCSKQEFGKAFDKFTTFSTASLSSYQYFQVITSLHVNIEDEFQSLCLQTQALPALDTVEQLVEEQSMDPLTSNKTNIMDFACNLSTEKKNEMQYLTRMLERVDEQNRFFKARIELLKKGRQYVSGMTDVKKFRSGILRYGTCNNGSHDP